MEKGCGVLFQEIIPKIEVFDLRHARKIKENIKSFGPEYFVKVEVFLSQYILLLEDIGKDLDYAIECYLKMCSDVMYEQVRFIETGKYSNESFEEVKAHRVYIGY